MQMEQCFFNSVQKKRETFFRIKTICANDIINRSGGNKLKIQLRMSPFTPYNTKSFGANFG